MPTASDVQSNIGYLAKHEKQRNPSPVIGVLLTALVLSSSAIPYVIIRRRFARSDKTMKNIVNVAKREHQLELSRHHVQLVKHFEALGTRLDETVNNLEDVRTMMLKDRIAINALATRVDGMSEQLKSHEKNVLSGLAVGSERTYKTEATVQELRKTASINARKLSHVGDSLAEIATFIDRTEIEQGVLPQPGKESSLRVNNLRSKALDLVEDKQ